MTTGNVVSELPEPQSTVDRPRSMSWSRRLVYVQLALVPPSIVLGHYEVWGYSWLLDYVGIVLVPLIFTPMIFPVAVLILISKEPMRSPWSFVALPMSVGLSAVQTLAFLPLVQ
jgi:hypothetical protein